MWLLFLLPPASAPLGCWHTAFALIPLPALAIIVCFLLIFCTETHGTWLVAQISDPNTKRWVQEGSEFEASLEQWGKQNGVLIGGPVDLLSLQSPIYLSLLHCRLALVPTIQSLRIHVITEKLNAGESSLCHCCHIWVIWLANAVLLSKIQDQTL